MNAYRWLVREWNLCKAWDRIFVIVTQLLILRAVFLNWGFLSNDSSAEKMGENAAMLLCLVAGYGLLPFVIAASARKRGRSFLKWYVTAVLIPGPLFTGIAYLFFGQNPINPPEPTPEQAVQQEKDLKSFIGM